MINFCHIAPTPHLEELTAYNRSHLILAHLVESDPRYREFYANLDDGHYKIMDNSAFEKFKAGEPMYPASKLIEMGNLADADCVVLSDFPMEPGEKTINAAKELIPQFKDAGFDTFFVPQSKVGDLSDYLNTMEWALGNDEIDLIGVSILGAPIALGLREQTYDSTDKVDQAYKMQRFLSRWHMMNILEDEGFLSDGRAQKRFHFLGMVDGPNEIELVRDYHDYIYSWDSSAAVWAGLNGILFDNSPTGLRNGKFEKEVDFNYESKDRDLIDLAIANILTINSMCC